MDIAKLGFVVETGSVKAAANDLNALTTASTGAEGASNKLSKGQSRLQAVVASLDKGFASLAVILQSIDGKMSAVAEATRRSAEASTSMATSAANASKSITQEATAAIQAKAALEGVSGAAEKAAKSLDEMGEAVSKTTGKLPGAAKAVDDVVDATKRVVDATDKIDGRTNKVTTEVARSFEFSAASIRRVAVGATAVLGSLAGLLVAGSLVRTSDEYVQMTNRLRLLGYSAEGAVQRLNEIAEVAQRTRSPLQATTQLYQRVSIASKDLGASQKDVMTFTENVGLALAQQGGSAQSAAGALLQLSQAMGAGTVRAEEFNSILEGAYPIAQAAANGIKEAGGSVARLRQLVIDGKIKSKEFFDAVLGQTDKLKAAFASAVPTVGQAMQVLRDQWTLAVGQMNGGMELLSKGILLLADGIGVAANFISANMNQIVGTIIAAGTALTAYLAPAIYSVASAVTVLGASLITLRRAIAATGIGAMIVLAGYMVGKFLDLVDATGGFGNALSTLGELAGAVWQGIIGSAGAIPPGLAGVWNQIRAGFYGLVADLQRMWYSFLVSMGNGLAGLGADGPAATIGGIAEKAGAGLDASLEKAGAAAKAASQAYSDAGSIISKAWAPAKAKIDQMSAAVEKAKSSSQQAASSVGKAMGSAGVGGGGGGGAKGRPSGSGAGGISETEKAANKASEALEKLRQQHTDLQATMGMSEAQQRIYAATQDLGTGATAAQRAEVERLIPQIDRLQAAQDRLKEVADTVKDGFGTLFSDAITGAKSLKSAIGDLAGKLAEMFANQAFNALWGQFGGGITSALTGGLGGAIPSFAGGGYTWDGQRTGGMDGRGGRLAMLHPRETVVDHTKAGGSAQAANMNVHVTVAMDESGNLHVRKIAQQEAASMGSSLQKASPAQVQRSIVRPRERR